MNIAPASRLEAMAMLFSEAVAGAAMRRDPLPPDADAVDRLLELAPFDYGPEWPGRFVAAMRSCLRWHHARNGFYRRFCLAKGFDPGGVDSLDAVLATPPVLVDLFKAFDLRTPVEEPIAFSFTTSGTGGQRSVIPFDLASLRRVIHQGAAVYHGLGLMAPEVPCSYLMATYDPLAVAELGTANTDFGVSFLAPARERFFALTADGAGGIAFRRDEAVAALHRFVAAGAPIRVLGFLHHACEIFRAYHKLYGRVRFPPGSLILSGGGWKQAGAGYGPEFDLYGFLATTTTLRPEDVRDSYSLVEHGGIMYAECRLNHKHVPNTALVCARDPRTLARLDDGQEGLLHLYTPLLRTVPNASLLSTDLGRVHRACTCGLSGPWMEITGRAGLSRTATCAITASNHLGGGRSLHG